MLDVTCCQPSARVVYTGSNSMTHLHLWRRCSHALLRAIRASWFFKVIFGVFLFQAVWIAVSGAYSMAYDEYFHYGIIKLYTHQWLPFFSTTPSGAAGLGAVTRDPSYLEHYLVSFPLRVFEHFFPAFMAQIMFLRLLDVAFFAAGILVFRAVAKRAGLSRAASNVVFLFLLLLPVAPFMAAQVNYDDLMFLLTAVSLLLGLKIVQQLRAKATLPLRDIVWLLITVMTTSLVKYTFLPILLALAIYLFITLAKTIGLQPKKLWPALRHSLPELRSVTGIIACLLFVVGAGLFVERYVGNTVRYHTPTPQCNQVLDLDDCKLYDPFVRNYYYVQLDLRDIVSVKDKLSYPINWSQGMVRSLLFSIGPKQLNYPPGEPLPLAYIAAYVVGIGGLVLLVWRARWLWRQSHAYQLFMSVTVVYVGVLFVQNLTDFLHLGVAVAIQGRYLVPILPLVFILVAVAARDVFMRRQWLRKTAAPLLVTSAVLMVLGGGFMPFIIRSSDTWMWNNSFSRGINHTARNILWHETWK